MVSDMVSVTLHGASLVTFFLNLRWVVCAKPRKTLVYGYISPTCAYTYICTTYPNIQRSSGTRYTYQSRRPPLTSGLSRVSYDKP